MGGKGDARRDSQTVPVVDLGRIHAKGCSSQSTDEKESRQ